MCSTPYKDLPAEVRQETVTLLYDQVGCMLASATLPSCQPVIALVRRLGAPGPCSIVGHPLRTSITNAALANGTIGHGDEVDSTGQHGTGHYAATKVPTALSVGQYVDASGPAFIRALTLGSEVAARLQSLLGHYGTRPQFTASVGGALGAAVVTGLLLGLDAGQLEHAIGLAASGACGLSSHHGETLHQIKSLNHGPAAKAGVLSALLAQEGYHGPPEVLTCEHGFFDAFLGLPGVGSETVMTNHHPSVHLETVLSLAAVYGELTFAHIHDLRCRGDPRVQAFRERTRIFMLQRPEPASMGQRLEMGLTVRTRSGEALHQELRYPLMTMAEIAQKFRDLVELRLERHRVADLERQLKAVESAENVAPLIRAMMEVDS